MSSQAFANYSNQAASLRSTLQGRDQVEGQEKEDDRKAFMQEMLQTSSQYSKEKAIEQAGKVFANTGVGGSIIKTVTGKDPTPLKTAAKLAKKKLDEVRGGLDEDGLAATTQQNELSGVTQEAGRIKALTSESLETAQTKVTNLAQITPSDTVLADKTQALSDAKITAQGTAKELDTASTELDKAKAVSDKAKAVSDKAKAASTKAKAQPVADDAADDLDGPGKLFPHGFLGDKGATTAQQQADAVDAARQQAGAEAAARQQTEAAATAQQSAADTAQQAAQQRLDNAQVADKGAQDDIVSKQTELDNVTNARTTAENAQTGLADATAEDTTAAAALKDASDAETAAKDAADAAKIARVVKVGKEVKDTEEIAAGAEESGNPLGLIVGAVGALVAGIMGSRVKVHSMVAPPKVNISQLASYASTPGA